MTAELDLAATTGGVLATPTEVDELGRLTAAWLLSFRSPNTRRAYTRDLQQWLGWCDRYDVDPRTERIEPISPLDSRPLHR